VKERRVGGGGWCDEDEEELFAERNWRRISSWISETVVYRGRFGMWRCRRRIFGVVMSALMIQTRYL
jgi:hypothetical protein